MANYKTGAQRHNDRMEMIMEAARRTEGKRIASGEAPNPSLTGAREYEKHLKATGHKKREIAKKIKASYSKKDYGYWKTNSYPTN